MLTQVDFYILSDTRGNAPELMACRLSEKAWQAGQQVFVFTSSPTQTEQLNELMWTFKQNSFVPHCSQPGGAKNCPDDPVVIGGDPLACHEKDILINLSEMMPSPALTMKRIIEIIPVSEPQRTQGRERYKQYRALGCEPTTHQV